MITRTKNNSLSCQVRRLILMSIYVSLCVVLHSQDATIKGNVVSGEGLAVHASVTLVSAKRDAEPVVTTTDDNGDFEFGGLTQGEDYFVSLAREGDFLNGVSTLDLVLIQKHILKEELFVKGDIILAADVNIDGNISVQDVVMLRKLILGNYRELPHGRSWRFLYDVPDSFDEYPHNVIEGGVLLAPSSEVTHSFLMVKIGDTNYTAQN